MSTSWIRLWGERFALICLGCFLSLVLLEVGLRLASAFVGPRALTLGEVGEQRILTLGDSHTYGVFYGPEDSYPGQLQSELDERTPGRYRVLNLGLPGMSSSEIRARLPGWIKQYRPTATILCVGINNIWNETDLDSQTSGAGEDSFWDLRVVRFYRILSVRLQGALPEGTGRPEIERVLLADGTEGVEHRDAESGDLLIRHEGNLKERLDWQTAKERLLGDLRQIAEIHRQEGVEMILLTYSAFPLPGRPPLHIGHSEMSTVMAEFATEEGLSLVDVRPRFLELLPQDTPRSLLFHNEREGHPNPQGYAEIASALADHFEPTEGQPAVEIRKGGEP